MAEERQQSRAGQPQGQQGQQPSGQTTHETQSRGNGQQGAQGQHNTQGQQTGMARRGGGMPSLFQTDPFDIFRTSPFALMRRVMDDMDQYMGQFWTGRGGQGAAAMSGGNFSPAVEVSERDGKLIVCADLPGLSKDDVHVEVTDDMLTISGERRSQHEERQGGMFRSERSYGSFCRQFPLPQGVDPEQVQASFKDGVLEISMPAPQRQNRGRQIEIQGSSPSNTGAQAASSTEPQAASNTGVPQAASSTNAGRA
jgi:HSP20 family protein